MHIMNYDNGGLLNALKIEKKYKNKYFTTKTRRYSRKDKKKTFWISYFKSIMANFHAYFNFWISEKVYYISKKLFSTFLELWNIVATTLWKKYPLPLNESALEVNRPPGKNFNYFFGFAKHSIVSYKIYG